MTIANGVLCVDAERFSISVVQKWRMTPSCTAMLPPTMRWPDAYCHRHASPPRIRLRA